MVFAGVQFFLTLARVAYPAPQVWLPLLAGLVIPPNR
jgi:hypothetical protein